MVLFIENCVWCWFRTRGEWTALTGDILPTSQDNPLRFLANTTFWSSSDSLIPIQSSTLLEQVEVKSHVRAAYYSDESLCVSHKLCSSHKRHRPCIPDNADEIEILQSSKLRTSLMIKQQLSERGTTDPSLQARLWLPSSERHQELKSTVKCASLSSQAAGSLSTDYVPLFQYYSLFLALQVRWLEQTDKWAPLRKLAR